MNTIKANTTFATFFVMFVETVLRRAQYYLLYNMEPEFNFKSKYIKVTRYRNHF